MLRFLRICLYMLILAYWLREPLLWPCINPPTQIVARYDEGLPFDSRCRPTLQSNFNQTAIWVELLEDPVMQPFAEDLHRQLEQEKFSQTGVRLGIGLSRPGRRVRRRSRGGRHSARERSPSKHAHGFAGGCHRQSRPRCNELLAKIDQQHGRAQRGAKTKSTQAHRAVPRLPFTTVPATRQHSRNSRPWSRFTRTACIASDQPGHCPTACWAGSQGQHTKTRSPRSKPMPGRGRPHC